MAWIESHQSNRDHPKIIRAARALGISKVTMLGHLHLLWYWALDYAQDGNLSAFEPNDIAEAAEWQGDSVAFVNALAEAARIGGKPGLLEYCDGVLVIHDWYDYAGKLIDRRRDDAERKRAGRSKEVRGTSVGHPPEVLTPSFVPYRTVPNPTQPNKTEQKEVVVNRAQQATTTTFEAFNQARAGAINPMDSEQLGELEALYGTEAMVKSIAYCNQHRKQPFLSIGYISKTLAGWQKDGGIPDDRSNGNGPKTFKVDFGGIVEEREA